jgi:hypothetical protein
MKSQPMPRRASSYAAGVAFALLLTLPLPMPALAGSAVPVKASTQATIHDRAVCDPAIRTRPRCDLHVVTDGSAAPAISLAGPASGSYGPPDFQSAYNLPNWVNRSALPTSLYRETAVLANGYIFLIGGNGGNGAVGTVYSGRVDSSGLVSAWASQTSLPHPLQNASAVFANGYIFVTGGDNGTTIFPDVYSAQVNSAGGVAAWTNLTLTPLPRTLSQHSAVVANGFIFVTGGVSGNAPTTPLSGIYSAQIQPNGTLVQWTTNPTPMINPLRGHSAVATNGYLITTGGISSSGTPISSVYTGTISGGTVNPMTLTTSLPTPLSNHVSILANGNLTVIGGDTGSSTTGKVYNAAVNISGVAGPWTTSWYQSQPRESAAAVLSSGTVSLFGGFVIAIGTVYSTVYTAPINVISGTTQNGSPATVAIVYWSNDPNAESDLQVYRNNYGLPVCTTANGCFLKINQNGATGSYPPNNSTDAEEISADLDMVSAGCPNCRILLVEAKGGDWTNLQIAENQAASYGTTFGKPNFVAVAINNSYGQNETDLARGGNNELQIDAAYNHPGVAVIASSQDAGYAGGTQYPAASQYVMGVGGTNLTKTNGIWSQTVWNNGPGKEGGSGCSSVEPKPTWQKDPSCSDKMVADVAAVADGPNHVAIYDHYGFGGWLQVSGTSLAAPLVSAMTALAGASSAVQYPASLPYASPTMFTDITSGNNGTCSIAYYCTAEVGYDGPTGIGTPNGVSGFSPPAFGSWHQQTPPSSPSARGDANMAYDAATGSVVLFGGIDNSGTSLNDTWTWNGTAWTQQTPATSPPPRGAAAMAYDSATGSVVLFGGRGSSAVLSDTWSWNGTTWTALSPQHSPSARMRPAFTYDAAASAAVLFGGWTGQQASGETWTWNGSDWTQITGSSPSARDAASMTYDPINGVALLFGGVDETVPALLSDTWTWNGTGWQHLNPTASPTPRAYSGMDYDATTGTSILFAGTINIFSGQYANDTWAWNGSIWVQQSPPVSPPARSAFPLTFDPPAGSLLIFGGYGAPVSGSMWGDTWTY